MNEILLAKDIHRIYQDGKHKLHVLKGVDLSLEKGDILVIQGPSGCGKSTLLHILGALDTPTKGEVLLDGVSVYKTDDAARSRIRNERIGFVFQFYHLLAEFNALENVMMPALIKNQKSTLRLRSGLMVSVPRLRSGLVLSLSKDGVEPSKFKIQERAKELLEKVGLSGRINYRPGKLSGGEAQRVAIARALMNKPDLVLCDEPTGNLDYDNSMAIFKLIKELSREQALSFVIVTHEREYAKLFSRVKYLEEGKLKD